MTNWCSCTDRGGGHYRYTWHEATLRHYTWYGIKNVSVSEWRISCLHETFSHDNSDNKMWQAWWREFFDFMPFCELEQELKYQMDVFWSVLRRIKKKKKNTNNICWNKIGDNLKIVLSWRKNISNQWGFIKFSSFKVD